MLVALDSAIFIYALGSKNRELEQWCATLLERINSGELNAVASTICLAEVMVKPLRLSPEAAQDAQLLLEGLEHFDYVGVDEDVALISASLRARNGSKLKLIDALHLATALASGAEVFITNDYGLEKLDLPGLRVCLVGQRLF
jgi:predicted nucleic acid-binding protein